MTNRRAAQDRPDLFSPHQRERLTCGIEALRANHIRLRKARTRLFPANLSTAIFVHLVEDPVTELPRTLGILAVDGSENKIESAFWTLTSEEERLPTWQAFSERLSTLWKNAIGGGKGPHLVHFGSRVPQSLHAWGELAEEGDRLAFLWRPDGSHRTDLRRLLREHFDFPIPGRLTLFGLAWVLGFAGGDGADRRRPESFFHDDPDPLISQQEWRQEERLREASLRDVERRLDLQSKIWEWTRRHLVSDVEQQDWQGGGSGVSSPAAPYLHFLEEERRLREEDILALQEYSLRERVERFRALGPLTFIGTSLDEEGRFLYDFRIAPENALSKFREDDFLRLAPLGSSDLQSGFPVILARADQGGGTLSVLSRQGRLALSKRLSYSLEEDLTDWNHPRLVQIVQTTLGGSRGDSLSRLLSGRAPRAVERDKTLWIQERLRTFEPLRALNASQQEALALPFRSRLALIEGPPGTGKTHLLGWIIIALLLEAHESGKPCRIAVSALTHRAIDGVLRKVVDLVHRHGMHNFSARVLKEGRWTEEPAHGAGQGMSDGPEAHRVERLDDPRDIHNARLSVLGATGFGLHRLFAEKTGTSPQVFDWVILDEASQLLVPQALLSLAVGKGNFVFVGDIKQLPPVVLGSYPEFDGATTGLARGTPLLNPDAPLPPPLQPHGVGKSILEHLLNRAGAEHRVRLDETFRMSEALCAFPSRMWYDGALHAAAGNAAARLDLQPDRSLPLIRTDEPPDVKRLDAVLDPEKPVVLVLTDHHGCRQKSDIEVDMVTQLACRLMTRYGLSPDRMALISPHRAHNNATASRLRDLLGGGAVLPVIDTVERLQGAERDVILFATTTSDPDHVMSEFLNNPNRFNVAITRARTKLIVVGSRAFFLAVPQSEEALRANLCFKEFLQFCRERKSLFLYW